MDTYVILAWKYEYTESFGGWNKSSNRIADWFVEQGLCCMTSCVDGLKINGWEVTVYKGGYLIAYGRD